MWKLIFLALLGCVVFSCQNNSQISITISIKSEVAGEDEFGYRIEISDSSIVATKHKSILIDDGFELGEVLEEEIIKIGKIQQDSIVVLIEALGDLDYYHKYDNAYVSDDWLYTITIGNAEPIVLFKYYLSLKEFEELKNLTDYILELCPIEIELRRFA